METGGNTMDTVAASAKKKYSSVHQRSAEKKLFRNKEKKQRRKEQRKRLYEAKKKETLEKDEKLLLLERQNSVLKREVQKTRKVAASGSNRMISMNSLSVSILHQNRNKNVGINRFFTSRITTFRRSDVIDLVKDIHSGAFGSVFTGYIKSIQQRVAVKKMDENSTSLDVLVEAKITSHLASLSGGIYFPYVYGITDSKCILLEFIGENNKFSPNLHTVMEKSDLSKSGWIQVLTEICKGFSFMHTKNILHNDVHSKNIVLRNKQFVKIIDFGKATLISDPLRYDIKRGSERQKKFNTKHCHLAYELRNVPGSYQSMETDVFSIGYTFGKVAQRLKWEGLDKISTSMMNIVPANRSTLSKVVFSLGQLGTKVTC